jgi:Glycosyl transferase family 2
MSRSALLPRESSDSAFVSRASSPSGIGPTVTILLGTLNGERFLPEQLASLERKTFKNWKLIASDDGWSDRTESILHAFQKSFEPGKVEIIAGPQRGAPANFLFVASLMLELIA